APGSGVSAPAGPSAAAGTPGATGGGPATTGGGSICDQAERFGRWPAGSEQARLCHNIYG
ncbi:hypothetical protein ACFVXQ_22235, partial [Kitasatospora sp. NPDC058263]